MQPLRFFLMQYTVENNSKFKQLYELVFCLVVVSILVVFYVFNSQIYILFNHLDDEAEVLKNKIVLAKTLAKENGKTVKAELHFTPGYGEKSYFLVKTALEEGDMIIGWETVIKEKLHWDHYTEVIEVGSRSQRPGSSSGKYNNFWVIFYKDGAVRTDPSPFELVMFQRSDSWSGDADNHGWRLRLDKETGEVEIQKFLQVSQPSAASG
jgi:hypothetical protein